MFETAYAIVIVVACLAMLGRLAIGVSRRERLDGWLHATWRSFARRVYVMWHWRAARAAARRAADEALQRARAGVHRDGNVIPGVVSHAAQTALSAAAQVCQMSFSVAVRLKTRRPGPWSTGSAMK